MTRRLREVADDILALEALYIESDGEVTPALEAWQAENAANLASRVDAYGSLLQDWSGEAATLKAEEDRLAARRKTLDNSGKRLKDWLCITMAQLGESKLKGELYTVSRQRNGTRPLTLVLAASELPAMYLTTPEPVVNMKAIALDMGKPDSDEVSELKLPDGRVVARLEPAGFHARVR